MWSPIQHGGVLSHPPGEEALLAGVVGTIKASWAGSPRSSSAPLSQGEGSQKRGLKKKGEIKK